MFGWDPKSQGKNQTLMNGVYHEEIIGHSREHSQYNKGGTTYRIVEKLSVIHCQTFIYVI